VYVVVLITVCSKKEAQRLAKALLNNKLAACINIVDKVRSLFWWQKKIDSADELLLVAKTRKSKLKALMAKVKSIHSYTVPEIIALPIVAGYGPYLSWIDESLR
jgi:periplasmic divalent cation tolerance protein